MKHKELSEKEKKKEKEREKEREKEKKEKEKKEKLREKDKVRLIISSINHTLLHTYVYGTHKLTLLETIPILRYLLLNVSYHAYVSVSMTPDNNSFKLCSLIYSLVNIIKTRRQNMTFYIIL